MFASTLYRKFTTKRLLLSTLVAHGLSLCLFPFGKSSYALLMVSRFATGLTQVLLYLHLPAWLDLKATGEKQKTIMMSLLLYSGALGVLLGYMLTA